MKKKLTGFIRSTLFSTHPFIVFLRYLFSALASFGIDIGCYTFFLYILPKYQFLFLLLASIGARIISSLFNYYLNRELVFAKKSWHSLLLYMCLATLQIFLSAACIAFIHSFFHVEQMVSLKILVDGFLFLLSFYIQKKFIFI